MMPTAILDLDSRLAGDEAGWERDILLERLRERRREVRRGLDKGVPPDRYAVLSAELSALDAAMEIVPLLWARLRVSGETSTTSARR